MIKKILLIGIAVAMILLSISSAVEAAQITETLQVSGMSNKGFALNNYASKPLFPIIQGPYPRYYNFYKSPGSSFRNDDFNGFDDFIGYREIDVFNPDGTIDRLRSDIYTPLETLEIPEGMTGFGDYVYGMLPGGSIYKKHYIEHTWEEGYYYGYYGYNYYYTPYVQYHQKIVVAKSF